MYSPENAEKIIIRCYIQRSAAKVTESKPITDKTMQEYMEKLTETVIRGVDRIEYTEVVNVVKSVVADDGSIKTQKIFGISTTGSNLEVVYEIPYVDKTRTQTDSIQEMQEMFGVEAARTKIIYELRKVITGALIEYSSVFADEMTFTGEVTSLLKGGLQAREPDNVTLRVSYQSPIPITETAAKEGAVDELYGVSGRLLAGMMPMIGTCYNDVCVNHSFVMEQNAERANAIDSL